MHDNDDNDDDADADDDADDAQHRTATSSFRPVEMEHVLWILFELRLRAFWAEARRAYISFVIESDATTNSEPKRERSSTNELDSEWCSGR